MKMLRRLYLLFFAICLSFTLVCPVAALPETYMNQTSGCVTLDAPNCVAGTQPLLDTAKAAVLFEQNSGTMVYSLNPDVTLDPSGMNKIMTALLAVEMGDPEQVVTVTRTALDSLEIGALTAGLTAGEEITLGDLLYCMMVGSANDAAAVIAEHIAGGQAAFVNLMNNRAQELGCTNTVFMNPSGLSQENQYTTARDLAKITAAALEREDFCQYFGAETYTVPKTNKAEERALVTTNFLMSKETVSDFIDERVTGGKTGAFSTTDRSLICTAESEGVRYLSVVMGAQGTKGTNLSLYANFKETGVLLNHGFDQYSLRRLLTTDQVLDRFAVANGENDVAVTAATEIYVMMPRNMDNSAITYHCVRSDSAITAPLEAGKPVGTVQVMYESLCVAQGELVAMHSVTRPDENNLPVEIKPLADTKGSGKAAVLISVILILTIGLILGIVTVIRKYRRPKKRR